MSSDQHDRPPDLSFLWPDDAAGPWVAEIDLAEIGGRSECVGLRIAWAGYPRPPEPLRTSDLRRLRLAEMIGRGRPGPGDLDVTSFVRHLRHNGELDVPEAPSPAPPSGPKGGRPPLYDDEYYDVVAEVYRRAFAAGLPPRKAVAEWFKASDSAASKWVAEARKRGALPPTERGVARADEKEQD